MEWGGALPKLHPTEIPRGGAIPPHCSTPLWGGVRSGFWGLWGGALSDQICLVWGAASGIFSDRITQRRRRKFLTLMMERFSAAGGKFDTYDGTF